jgi:flagellar biosynthesis protein FlhF
MQLESFQGSSLRAVFDDVRQALGEDALIIRSDMRQERGRVKVEVVAARAEDLVELEARLTLPPPTLPRDVGGRGRSGPFIIAVVGPTGAGKTTTAAKLALHPDAFGGSGNRVGFLTLDTYRAGALEQINAFAEIAELPLEVVYEEREVVSALERLDSCDVVIVDTPGRGPREHEASMAWQTLLREIAPDEIHLVVPATMRPDVASTIAASYSVCPPTHLLVSKTDEVPDDSTVATMMARIDLPSRWHADGQCVPDDLEPAYARVMTELGLKRAVARAEVAA